MNAFAVCGFAVLSAILCTVLRAFDGRAALAVSAAAAVTVALYALSVMSPVVKALRDIAGTAQTGFITVFKALGISFFCSLACDICRQSGENVLAKQLEFAGKCVLCALCLPIVTELMTVITGLAD